MMMMMMMICKTLKKEDPAFRIVSKQDAVEAHIWAWSYDRYDTLNMPYCS